MKSKKSSVRSAAKAWSLAMALGAVGGLGVASCDRQGPAEQAGEKIDEATGASQDSMAKAGDKMGDAMHDAGDKMKDAADDAKSSIDKATEPDASPPASGAPGTTP